jgi:RHS repeat-associated protein
LGDVSAQVATQDGSAMTNGTAPLHLGTIGPNQHLPLNLTASLNTPTCSEDEGLVYVTVSANYNHYEPSGWYDLFGNIVGDPTQFALGQEIRIPLWLANVGYPESSNLNTPPPDLVDVTLTPPQQLTWMSVSTTTIESIPVNGEVGFELIVNAPQWLTQGFYYDYIQISASNGITAVIGIVAEMTPTGLRVEAQFVTPLNADDGGDDNGGGTGPGDPPPPVGGPQPPDWVNLVNNWNPNIFTPQNILVDSWQLNVGCYCGGGGGGGGGWSAVGNSLVHTFVGSAPGPGAAYAPDFKDNIVILRLQQRYSLEREAFTAQLALGNGLAGSITDLTVEIIFSDDLGQPVPLRQPGNLLEPAGQFEPVIPSESLIPPAMVAAGIPSEWQQTYPVNFIIIPETPTDLPDLPSGAGYNASWTLVPDAMGLTHQARFQVQAIISYKVNGVPKSVVTTPASVTVNPAPRIVLDYFIPNYVLGGQTFDWLVVATNVGYGTARKFRVETPQPEIIKQSELYPTNFTLVGPSVLNFGDVPSGGQVSGVWRILPSEPGMFVGWEASCIQQSYKGVMLPPLVYCVPNVHFLDTSYLAEAQQWAKEDSCVTGLYQGFDSDPVNTYSGNFTYSATDLSIPGWSQPLAFERSYNSRDTKDGPFGPGWTHNYNMYLTYESFLAVQAGNVVGQQNMFSARLPHGSMAYFDVSADGETITPFPGTRTQLSRNLTTYTLTQECTQTFYTFNAEQKLSAIEDANGNRTTLTYNSNDNLALVTDPAGRTLTFEYNGNGRVTRITDPLGRSYVYSYTNGYLTAMADFRGQVTQFTYTMPQGNEPGLLVSIIRPDGSIEVYNHYDNQRRVGWQEDALGKRTTFNYSYSPLTEIKATTLTDPLGNVTIDTYDAEGRLVQRKDAHGFFEEYEYDDDFNMIELVDKNGHVTEYAWSDCGCNVEQVTDPLNHSTIMIYDDKKQVTSIQDKRGYVTTFSYDDRSNLIAMTNPVSGTKTYTYGERGELLSETDENGHTTFYGYDSYGNMVTITNALGYTSQMTYDLAGRLISSTDALNQTTYYLYDDGDNLIEVGSPLSATTVYTYNSVGYLVALQDALGRVTTYTYSPRGEILQVVNPLGGVRSFVYDANRNLIAATDEDGRTTTNQYDGLNRLIRVTNPLSGTVRYTYDPTGNRLTEQDPNGNITAYVYDANNRIVKTVYPDGSEMTAVYDQADNLLRLTDSESRTISYTYNALGRIITMTNPLSGTVGYRYDAAGNRTQLIDPEGRVVTYTFDALHRLIQVTDPLSGTTQIAYDAAGNQISVTNAAGQMWRYDYNELNRLVQFTDPLTGTTQYAYDLVGNQVHVTDTLVRVTIMAYDDLNRPVSLTNPLSGTIHYLYDAAGNVRQVIDEEGRSTQYDYDALYRPISVTDTLGGLTIFVYDANGNLLTGTDPEGRTTNYGYDVFNQLITVTNALGEVTRYEYSGVGNLLRMVDAHGHTFEYVYDALDRLITARDPLSNTTQYAYDGVGNLVSLIDAEGTAVTYTYDLRNRPVTVTNALGGITTYMYDALSNLVAVTDAEGKQVTFVYDELNRLTHVADALGQVITYTYDAAGNQIGAVDALGRVTVYGYDELNRVTAVTNPISGTTAYTYSAAGNLVTAQDALGHVTTFSYDGLNRPLQVTDSLGHSTSYAYDRVGNPLQAIDALGRAITFTYDALNRPLQIVDPLGAVTAFSYDAVGNRASVTDANQRTIHYGYDPLNRLVTVTDPLAQISRFTYDRVGNQIAFTDPLSRTTGYSYDALYRLTAVTDPAGNLTTFAYDQVGNQTSLTDAEGRATTVTYDALNRPIVVTDPLSGTIQFVYDAAGNPVNRIDAAGRVYTYTYDALDRLQAIMDPLSHVTQYQYDALGNLLAMTDPLGRQTTYQYDPLSRLTLATNALSGTIQFQYDAVGNLVSQIDPLNKQVVYSLDALNRVVQVQNPVGGLTTYQYDPVGNLLSATDAKGFTSQMAYDELNRLRAVTNPLGQAIEYAYDAVGNNVAIIDPLGRATNFVYDELDRLIAATDPLSRTTSYSYDRVGNSVSMVDPAGVVTQYTYDPLNRLTAVTENFTENGPSNAAANVTTAFTYDSAGNLTGVTNPLGRTFTFAYDPLNRLTRSEDPLGRGTTYTYDAAGNLAQSMDANNNTTSYSYDALNRLTAITRPDESVAFTYDVAGNRLSMSDATGVTFYSYDDLYRLVSVADPLNQVVQYSYDAVGNRTGLIYPDGDQVSYFYDAAGRMVQVVDWDNGQAQYVYDDAGRLVELVLPNGVTGTLAYDEAGQLTLLQYEGITGTLASYAYSYDPAGNRIQAVETLAEPTSQLPPDVFLEVDGLVVMEAEHYYTQVTRSDQEWQPRQALAGYEGNAYLQLLPDVGAIYAGDYVTSSPELQYRIYFSNTGVYTVWIYGAAVDAAGDSLHVGVNGAANVASAAISGFSPNQWGWSARATAGGTTTPATATITINTPGLYTLNIWGREDGLRLDRILLALDPNYTPEGSGPAASERGGQIQTAAAVPAGVAAAQPTPNWRVALAIILANPFWLLLASLGALSPLAYRRRYRWAVQVATAVAVVLTLVGFGAAAVYAAPPGIPGGGGLYNLPPGFGETTTINYNYDALYRLTNAAYSSGHSFAYTYDAAGNRLSLSRNGVQVAAYSYDDANRLLQLHNLVDDELVHYSYDNNGNLLSDGDYTYNYDTANRLTLVADGISSVSYLYNGDGARVAQIEDGLRTDYVQDVALPLPQVLTARQGGTVSRYLRGLGLIGEQQGGTGPFAAPAVWQYHLPDALGSVRQVVDGQGQVALARHYDPFGGLLATGGNAISRYGFTGEEQDLQRGHVYLRARTYAPATGRFLQQDTVLGTAAQPRSLHRYAYAFNNPINYTDPSGHMPPQAKANGPVYSGNSGSAPQGGSGPTLPFFGQSGRSANSGGWSTYSNALSRLQSEGFRPALCGLAQAAFDTFSKVYNDFEALVLKPVRQSIETLKNSQLAQKTATVLRELKQRGEQNPELVALAALIAAGTVMAVAAVLTGGAALIPMAIGAVLGAGSGVVGQFVQDIANGAFTTGQWSSWKDYALQGAIGAIGGAVAGLVAPVSMALGPVAGGAITGFTVGAVTGLASNLATGRPWHEGIAQLALSGAAAGAVSGGVLGRLSPTASLATRMAAGGATGGLVSGGTHAAMNVMQGRPWHEGVGTAVAVGLATGLVDGAADHYVGRRIQARHGKGRSTSSEDGDARLTKEIYERVAESSTGQAILKQVDQMGKRPMIMFSDDLLGSNRVGSYYPKENVIKLNPELKGLPKGSVEAVVAHELIHRLHRQMLGSKASEIVAHLAEGQVWQELGGPGAMRNLDSSKLSDFQRSILQTQTEISQIKTVDAMLEYVRPKYANLPDYSVSYVENYQREIQIWKSYREHSPNQLWIDQNIKKVQENLDFWKSFKE